MSRLEELARKHFPPDSNTAQIQYEKTLAFGRELLEEAAKTVCDCCADQLSTREPSGKYWHCCNRRSSRHSATHQCKASSIRSLADSGERRGDGEA